LGTNSAISATNEVITPADSPAGSPKMVFCRLSLQNRSTGGGNDVDDGEGLVWISVEAAVFGSLTREVFGSGTGADTPLLPLPRA
jgi:hypothetical protein